MLRRRPLTRGRYDSKFDLESNPAAVLGPRQSGKMTLARELFPDFRYVSMEDPDLRLVATEDPRTLLLARHQGPRAAARSCFGGDPSFYFDGLKVTSWRDV